jgi:hypothetical protein
MDVNVANVDNVLIILTCTVKVNHYKHFLHQTNPTERLELYLKSIKQWLEKTTFKICVVENSGYTFPELSDHMEKYGQRFEIITFDECALPHELQHLMYNVSKGASEMHSINYAYEHTKFKQDVNFVIKITGRYFVPLFYEYLNDIDIKNRTRNIHVHDNPQFIIGLRQHERDGCVCEIVGIHAFFFKSFFHNDMSNDVGTFFSHVETLYHNRLKLFDQTKIINLPMFSIEPTQMGGSSCILTYL